MERSSIRYRVGTARRELAESWRHRPVRLREPFFSPERELRRIEARARAAAAGAPVALETWETHQPVVLALLDLVPDARMIELGTGYGSTPIVLGRTRESLSLETDPSWHRRFARYASAEHRVVLWDDYDATELRCPFLHEQWDIALVDNSPGSARQSSLRKLAERTRFVVCHDTEERFGPAASSYGWDFSAFRHVWTYARFPVYTTVVSEHEPIALDLSPSLAGVPRPEAER